MLARSGAERSIRDAVTAARADGQPWAIQERLGHSSITVTLDRHGHLFPKLDETLTNDSTTSVAKPSNGETTLHDQRHDLQVTDLVAAGLGLDYHDLQLARTTEQWIAAGEALRRQVALALGGRAVDVAVIGSSSVLGLLAKPIIDLAACLVSSADPAEVQAQLESSGWIYRGDARDQGGHVFVLETRPWHRVGHLHVVHTGDPQWQTWLRLRDLLRSSAEARDRYETVKTTLVEQHRDDRKAYTEAKTAVVRALLASTQP